MKHSSMKHPSIFRVAKLPLSAMLAVCAFAVYSSHAAVTDIATSPMGTSTTGNTVKPNIMFVLDASLSMDADYVPDAVNENWMIGQSVDTLYVCRSDSGGVNSCWYGDPPYYAASFNTLYYNEQLTYRPGVNADGSSRGSLNTSAKWAAAPVDSYAPPGDTSLNSCSYSGTTCDLVHNYLDIKYCNWAGTICKRNGVDNGKTFAYATPSKPSVTGVSFTRSGTTVTGTKAGHGLVAGDVIDIVGPGLAAVTSSR